MSPKHNFITTENQPELHCSRCNISDSYLIELCYNIFLKKGLWENYKRKPWKDTRDEILSCDECIIMSVL